MAVVRVCRNPDCVTILSRYNGGNYCSLHRIGPPIRIVRELNGDIVLADDDWVRRLKWKTHPPKEIEAWRPSVMSATFLKGMEEQIHPQDKKAYEDGSWLG